MSTEDDGNVVLTGGVRLVAMVCLDVSGGELLIFLVCFEGAE